MTAVVWVALFAVLATGCRSGDRPPGLERCPDLFEPEPVDPAGTSHVYVVASVDLASSGAEAQQLGIDLDGDPQCRADNALGAIASWFGDDHDLDAEANALIDAGAILHLLELEAVSREEASGVRVTIRHAVDLDGELGDNFTGHELFGVDASRGSGSATGRITSGGMLSVGEGTAPIALTFPGLDEPFLVPLVAVRIEAEVTPEGLSGRIGGAVLQDDVDRVILPAAFVAVNRVIARQCDLDADRPSCPQGAWGQTLVDLFDSDGDFVITLDELRDNDLISALLGPDVDLYDEDGAFAPRTDGWNDALSVGLGFTAVPAGIEQLPRSPPRPDQPAAAN